MFSVAVAVGAVTRQLVPGRHAVAAMVLVYEASVVWIACFLARRAQPAENPVVADLVVELDEAPGTELRRALGRALGDPQLDVGYLVDDANRRALRRQPRGATRRPAERRRANRDVRRARRHAFAVIVHDRAVLGDPTLVTAVATAARLNAVNVTLDAELRERLGEVAASRRRLLVAADEERERLADRCSPRPMLRRADRDDRNRGTNVTVRTCWCPPVGGQSAR